MFPKLLLECIGTPYVYKAYPQADPDKWFKDAKPFLPVATPNVPYLMDGDICLMEHDAILRYIARKWKPEMLGISDKEIAIVEMFFAKVKNMNMPSRVFCRAAHSDEERRGHVIGFDVDLKAIDK